MFLRTPIDGGKPLEGLLTHRLCSSPHYSELRGIIRWRSERPQKTI
jgi:hypothetical protein